MSFYGAFLWCYFYWNGLFELYFRLSVTEDSAKMEWRCSLWRRRDTKLCSLESVSLYAASHIVLLSVIWTDKHVKMEKVSFSLNHWELPGFPSVLMAVDDPLDNPPPSTSNPIHISFSAPLLELPLFLAVLT